MVLVVAIDGSALIDLEDEEGISLWLVGLNLWVLEVAVARYESARAHRSAA